jgi:short-subunit dehydrogenase
VEAAVAGLGGLDVVISNAGVGWARPFARMSEQDIDDLLGVPGEVWYSATKAGRESFADVLRAELRYSAIGVTVMTPA